MHNKAEITGFNKIAKLHSPNLEHTIDRTNWNKCILQISRINILLARGALNDAMKVANNLLDSSALSEVLVDLKEMVGPKNWDTVETLLKETRLELENLIKGLKLTGSMETEACGSPPPVAFS